MMKPQNYILILSYNIIIFFCYEKSQKQELVWKSNHFNILVKYSEYWQIKDTIIDEKENLKVFFSHKHNGSEFGISIETAPHDPYPETLMSITPMSKVYDEVLKAHPENKSLHKRIHEFPFHHHIYEKHVFEVHSNQWGSLRQDYLCRWLGKLYVKVILTYKNENKKELYYFLENNVKLFEE